MWSHTRVHSVLIKTYYHFNVVGIRIILHWDTDWECGINRGNTVYYLLT